MINTNKLKGAIANRGLSQSDVAALIGITPKAFYEKMKNGVFRSDEIQIMIDRLGINDPTSIFFDGGMELREKELNIEINVDDGRAIEKLERIQELLSEIKSLKESIFGEPTVNR